MAISLAGQQPAAWGALHETLLHQIGLDDLLDGVTRFGERGGNGFDADGAAVVEFGDDLKIAPVKLVEPARIDIETQQSLVGELAVDSGSALVEGKIICKKGEVPCCRRL